MCWGALAVAPRVAVVLLLLPLWVVGGASAGAPVCGGGAPAATPVQCMYMGVVGAIAVAPEGVVPLMLPLRVAVVTLLLSLRVAVVPLLLPLRVVVGGGGLLLLKFLLQSGDL